MPDVLLVISGNLGPVSHRFWDTVGWLKSPSFLIPSIGVTAFEFLKKLIGKVLGMLKLKVKSFAELTLKILVILYMYM